MTERWQVVETASPEPDITTIRGLKKEVMTAVVRYFAPVVAIYEALEETAGMPIAWQRKKLGEDRPANRG